MTEEGKGFVVRDKRAFDDKGESKQASEPEQTATETPGRKSDAGKKTSKKGSPPLPEVNFSALIFSLSSSVLHHLGELPDPQSGRSEVDLPLAKHAIDTIAMLKEKTRGNLSEEEQKFTDNVLTDLRWRYVKAAE